MSADLRRSDPVERDAEDLANLARLPPGIGLGEIALRQRLQRRAGALFDDGDNPAAQGQIAERIGGIRNLQPPARRPATF
jgi:hypothetical protein